MALKGTIQYLTCPMCDAEIPVSGDEKVGESIYCPYCQIPLRLRKRKGTEEVYLEEDL